MNSQSPILSKSMINVNITDYLLNIFAEAESLGEWVKHEDCKYCASLLIRSASWQRLRVKRSQLTTKSSLPSSKVREEQMQGSRSNVKYP